MNWISYSGITNGVVHTSYHASPYGCILKSSDDDGVILSVNGYQFKCPTVADAMEEAKERIQNNRGCYIVKN